MFQLRSFIGPAQCAERHQCRRKPGVQYIVIALKRTGVASRHSLAASIFLGAGNENFSVVAIPGRDLVAPPQLAGNTPVLNVVQPLVVGVHPLLGHKLHLALFHGINGFLSDAFSRCVAFGHFGHGHKPLVGQHGFNYHAGSVAFGHHQFVGFDFTKQAQFFKVSHNLLACDKTIHAHVFCRGVLCNGRIKSKNIDQLKLVALAHCVVVEVVGRCYFHNTCAK